MKRGVSLNTARSHLKHRVCEDGHQAAKAKLVRLIVSGVGQIREA